MLPPPAMANPSESRIAAMTSCAGSSASSVDGVDTAATTRANRSSRSAREPGHPMVRTAEMLYVGDSAFPQCVDGRFEHRFVTDVDHSVDDTDIPDDDNSLWHPCSF